MDSLTSRAEQFVELLRGLPHKHVAVVSHGVFLETLWAIVAGPTEKRYANCEMRVAFL